MVCPDCYMAHRRLPDLTQYTLEDAKAIATQIVPAPEALRELSWDKYRLSPANQTLRIDGGEPTVWPYLAAFLSWFIATYPNRAVVLTNGLRLAESGFLRNFPLTNQIFFAVSPKLNTLRMAGAGFRALDDAGRQYACIATTRTLVEMEQILDVADRFNPKEIRVRSIVNHQTGERYLFQSELIGFLCRRYGIHRDDYLAEMDATLPCATRLYGRLPFVLHTGLNPTWNTAILEEVAKCTTFHLGLRSMQTQAEAFLGNARFAVWRRRYLHEGVTKGISLAA
ncbi:MAG: hypothetical protein ABIL58_10440, partial [Pseudomonadota bacterium]